MAAWRSGLGKSFSTVTKRLRYQQYQDNCLSHRFISTTSITKQENIKEYRTFSVLKRGAASTAGNTQLQTLAEPEKKEITAQDNAIKNDKHSESSDQRTMEKFIPLTRQQLVKSLSKEHSLFTSSEITGMQKLSLSLDTYISRRFYIHLEELKVCYDVMQKYSLCMYVLNGNLFSSNSNNYIPSLGAPPLCTE